MVTRSPYERIINVRSIGNYLIRRRVPEAGLDRRLGRVLSDVDDLGRRRSLSAWRELYARAARLPILDDNCLLEAEKIAKIHAILSVFFVMP